MSWKRKSAGFEATGSLETQGNDVVINLTLLYPQTYQPDLAALKSDIVKGTDFRYPAFRLIKEERLPVKREGDQVIQSVTYTLSPQQTGEIFTSFQNIRFQSKEGGEDVTLPSGVFSVNSLSGAETLEQLPVADVMSLKLELPPELSLENRLAMETTERTEAIRSQQILNKKIFPWGGIALYLSILFFLFSATMLFLRYRSRFKKKPTPPNPFDVANKSLKKLSIQKIQTANEAEKFYTELTGELRHYIEGVYGIQAPEMTTEEFLHSLACNDAIHPPQKKMLSQLMTHADRIKFAKEGATQKDCQKALKVAQDFIHSHPETEEKVNP